MGPREREEFCYLIEIKGIKNYYKRDTFYLWTLSCCVFGDSYGIIGLKSVFGQKNWEFQHMWDATDMCVQGEI